MADGVIHLPFFPFPAEVETHRGHQRLSFLLIMMRETIEGCAKLLTQLTLLDGKPQSITIRIPGQPFFRTFPLLVSPDYTVDEETLKYV
jgi:hypothetical protein